MAYAPSLLPPNATPIEKMIEQAGAARLAGIPFAAVGELWNAQTCPSALLPWLAFSVGVSTWNSAWSDDVKRAVIAAAPAVDRQRGTVAAVKTAVAAMGADMVIQEWWQQNPVGEPGTFAILLTVGQGSGQEATADFVDDVVAAVSAAKNVRSHFTFTQGLAAAAQLGVYAYGRVATFRRLTGVAA